MTSRGGYTVGNGINWKGQVSCGRATFTELSGATSRRKLHVAGGNSADPFSRVLRVAHGTSVIGLRTEWIVPPQVFPRMRNFTASHKMTGEGLLQLASTSRTCQTTLQSWGAGNHAFV